MTKILEKKVRNSPILVSRLYRNWDTSYGKKKMIKMSQISCVQAVVAVNLISKKAEIELRV